MCSFGLVSNLDRGIAKLEEMRSAARLWASKTEDWPSGDRLGLFLHVYAHASVYSMHLHMLDLAEVGPSYHKLIYKNLSIDDAIAVLKTERESEDRNQLASWY